MRNNRKGFIEPHTCPYYSRAGKLRIRTCLKRAFNCSLDTSSSTNTSIAPCLLSISGKSQVGVLIHRLSSFFPYKQSRLIPVLLLARVNLKYCTKYPQQKPRNKTLAHSICSSPSVCSRAVDAPWWSHNGPVKPGVKSPLFCLRSPSEKGDCQAVGCARPACHLC